MYVFLAEAQDKDTGVLFSLGAQKFSQHKGRKEAYIEDTRPRIHEGTNTGDKKSLSRQWLTNHTQT